MSKLFFPSYKEVIGSLLSTVKEGGVLSGYEFYWMSEYGEYQHELCSRICEDWGDEDTIRKIGVDIDGRGGIVTLQACFYVMFHFCNQNPTDVKCLKYIWHGVGEWRR